MEQQLINRYYQLLKQGIPNQYYKSKQLWVYDILNKIKQIKNDVRRIAKSEQGNIGANH